MYKYLLNRKINNWIRFTILLLTFLGILFALFSYERHLGTYVFDKGSTSESSFKIITQGKKTIYELLPQKEVIGESFLYGNSSSLTVALALMILSAIGSIAQLSKLFNKRYSSKNLSNSIFIIVVSTISLGFSSILSVLLINLFIIIIQSSLLVASIMVEIKKKYYKENVNFVVRS